MEKREKATREDIKIIKDLNSETLTSDELTQFIEYWKQTETSGNIQLWGSRHAWLFAGKSSNVQELGIKGSLNAFHTAYIDSQTHSRPPDSGTPLAYILNISFPNKTDLKEWANKNNYQEGHNMYLIRNDDQDSIIKICIENDDPEQVKMTFHIDVRTELNQNANPENAQRDFETMVFIYDQIMDYLEKNYDEYPLETIPALLKNLLNYSRNMTAPEMESKQLEEKREEIKGFIQGWLELQ